MKATRSLVRSQWDKITFYGPKPKNGGYMEVDGISELAETPAPIKAEPPMPKVFDDEPDMVIEGRNHKGHSWKVRGRLTEEGFIVYAGSVANNVPPSFLANKVYFPLRQQLMVDGVIDENSVFTCDFTFKNATQAGCVVAASLIQARKAWHTEPDDDGDMMTYEECHPRARGVKMRERKARQRRKAIEAKRRAWVSEKMRKADAVVDGKAWHREWRGRIPVRKDGVYSPDTYVGRKAVCG